MIKKKSDFSEQGKERADLREKKKSNILKQ